MGISLWDNLIFFAISRHFEVFIPDSSAICPASCIIGPSPNGSLKGIPNSIMSTPDFIAESTIFSVLFFSGKPVVI